MYYPHSIEEICFDQTHIESVWDEMRPTILSYFQKYIETEGGHSTLEGKIEMLALKFGATSKPKNKPKDSKKVLERLLAEAINAFENERQDYINILDSESLYEYSADVSAFKNTTLKNHVPIIRKTLQNVQAKELDKFRTVFGISHADNLFRVTSNIVNLANELNDDWYSLENFDAVKNYTDLNYNQFDTEDYTVYGVIGGGIKSHFIYKLFPHMFSNRSREAVWGLYYLTNKKTFNCKENSEFLMINLTEGTTQQNYFYPYGLFAFYTIRIFNLLKELYLEQGITLPENYRFVPVDNFLSFVSRSHQAEIDSLKSKISFQYEH